MVYESVTSSAQAQISRLKIEIFNLALFVEVSILLESSTGTVCYYLLTLLKLYPVSSHLYTVLLAEIYKKIIKSNDTFLAFDSINIEQTA